jgi:hypothetical protein
VRGLQGWGDGIGRGNRERQLTFKSSVYSHQRQQTEYLRGFGVNPNQHIATDPIEDHIHDETSLFVYREAVEHASQRQRIWECLLKRRSFVGGRIEEHVDIDADLEAADGEDIRSKGRAC